MYKIKDCNGIEDIFSKNDFKSYVLNNDASLPIDESNSDYMKSKKLSKPVHAYKFLLKIKNKEISFNDFESETQDKINEVVGEVARRLNSK